MSAPVLVSDPQDDARPDIIGSTLSLTLLALIVTVSRTWIRIKVVKAFGWDDGLMLFAMLGVVATEGVIVAECHYGHGRHVGDVPPEMYAIGMMLNYVTQPMVFVFTSIVKLAVGAALLRIANKGVFKGIVIGVMAFTAFYTIGAFLTIVVQCRPISLNWDQSPANLAHGSCWQPQTAQALAYTSIALNIITDLLFALGIPIPMLSRLQMNRKTKVALLFVFSLGTLACVAAIVRLGYLTSYGVRTDWLWDARYLTIWTMVEVNIGIVAGSMPACKPMIKRLMETTQRYASRDKTPRGTGQGHTGGGSKGGSFWKSMGTRSDGSDPHLDDDVSSQRHINPPRDMYVMHDFGENKSRRAVVSTAVGSERGTRSDSPDSVEEIISQGSSPEKAQGITKTTTTTMSYLPIHR